MEKFSLGQPVVVCRWRLAHKGLPLENRHLRALATRVINNVPVSAGLVAWAKQHIEWTLAEGSYEHPDGVLMLVIDQEGKAAMTVGEYRALTHTAANDLLRRAKSSYGEACSTRVSPEDLWEVRGNTLVWGTSPEFGPCGASSLVADLARTLGIPVLHDEGLLARAEARGFVDDEVFLVSDEHGVVPASDRLGPRAAKFAASYNRLLEKQV
ncbi:MAG: hypothetical protein Q4A07_04030 [Coriobacteriales bacterium]|nr:hypothetical protein [Coriobacteriales bacterium]